jgi:indole-3-glycerol phosphate synthase
MGKDFLSKIIEYKKNEVYALKRVLPEKRLIEIKVSGEKRPFLKRLKEQGPSGINIIAEIKRASPSKGVINSDIDAALYAAEYEKGGACAISVLTDRHFFMGSLDDLIGARKSTVLPVLRKDFIISSYQIYESSAIGADAILLIVRILSENQLNDYISLCRQLKLETLVEVHSEKDLEIATNAGAGLIGINNRNLSSFKTDIEVSMRLSGLLKPEQTAVAASGINGRDDIEKNLSFGVYNFLIGESIVRSGNPAEFIRSLVSWKAGKNGNRC